MLFRPFTLVLRSKYQWMSCQLSNPCVCAKISGIATGQTLVVARKKYSDRSFRLPKKKTILERDQRFFAAFSSHANTRIRLLATRSFSVLSAILFSLFKKREFCFQSIRVTWLVCLCSYHFFTWKYSLIWRRYNILVFPVKRLSTQFSNVVKGM